MSDALRIPMGVATGAVVSVVAIAVVLVVLKTGKNSAGANERAVRAAHGRPPSGSGAPARSGPAARP
jgi:hypothetical protein